MYKLFNYSAASWSSDKILAFGIRMSALKNFWLFNFLSLLQNAIRVKRNFTHRTEMTCTINRSRFPMSINILRTKSQ